MGGPSRLDRSGSIPRGAADTAAAGSLAGEGRPRRLARELRRRRDIFHGRILARSGGVLSLLGAAVQNQLAVSRVITITAGLCDLGILLLVVSRASRDFFRGGRPG